MTNTRRTHFTDTPIDSTTKHWRQRCIALAVFGLASATSACSSTSNAGSDVVEDNSTPPAAPEALVDGIGRLSELELAAFPPGCGAETVPCAITPWPSGRIPYKFENSNASHPNWTTADKNAVIAAMTAWESATGNVIDFVEKTASDAHYVSFTNEVGTGCNSPLGYVGGTSVVRLRQCGSGAAQHELGHTLGLKHTHQRADRDRYLIVDFQDFCFPPDPPLNHCLPQDYISPGNPADDYCSYGPYTRYRDQLRGDNVPRCSNDDTDFGPFDFASLQLYAAGGNVAACDVTNPDENCCSTSHLESCLRTRRDGSANGAWYNGASSISTWDASAVVELYRQPGWRRFRPIVRTDPGPTSPLNTGLTSSVSIVGSPAMTRWDTSGVAIVARGSNKHYYVKYNSSGNETWPTGSWTDIGGDFTSDPAVVSWGPNRLDWVGVGADGNIWHRDINNGQLEPGGGNLGKPGTSTPSAPAIASWGPNRLDIFVRSGTELYQKSWTGSSWTNWTSRGGTFKGKPAAVSRADGSIDLFGIGSDDGVYHIGYNNGSWAAGYEALGGVAANGTGPAVATKGGTHLNVYVTGSNGRLWHQSWNGTWSGWYDIGGVPNGSPASATTTAGKAFSAVTITANNSTAAWTRFFF